MYTMSHWTTKELLNALECEREQISSMELSIAWLKGKAKKQLLKDIEQSETLCNRYIDELKAR